MKKLLTRILLFLALALVCFGIQRASAQAESAPPYKGSFSNADAVFPMSWKKKNYKISIKTLTDSLRNGGGGGGGTDSGTVVSLADSVAKANSFYTADGIMNDDRFVIGNGYFLDFTDFTGINIQAYENLFFGNPDYYFSIDADNQELRVTSDGLAWLTAGDEIVLQSQDVILDANHGVLINAADSLRVNVGTGSAVTYLDEGNSVNLRPAVGNNFTVGDGWRYGLIGGNFSLTSGTNIARLLPAISEGTPLDVSLTLPANSGTLARLEDIPAGLDTATMLTPYQSAINSRLKYTDTAVMLDRYFSRTKIKSLGVTGSGNDLNTLLPSGGFISSYSSAFWATNGPSWASFGGFISFKDALGNQGLDFYFNNGHDGTAHRLGFRTKDAQGFNTWVEVATIEWIAAQNFLTASTNFYNTDGILTGNREIDGNNFNVSFDNVNEFIVDSDSEIHLRTTDSLYLLATTYTGLGGSAVVDIDGGEINLTVGDHKLIYDNTGALTFRDELAEAKAVITDNSGQIDSEIFIQLPADGGTLARLEDLVPLSSGNYLPSTINYSNVENINYGAGFKYTRVGNIVNVIGNISFTASETEANQSIVMSLPIGSDLVLVSDVTGFANIQSSTNTGITAGDLIAETNDEGAQISFTTAISAGTVKVNVSFMYEIK